MWLLWFPLWIGLLTSWSASGSQYQIPLERFFHFINVTRSSSNASPSHQYRRDIPEVDYNSYGKRSPIKSKNKNQTLYMNYYDDKDRLIPEFNVVEASPISYIATFDQSVERTESYPVEITTYRPDKYKHYLSSDRLKNKDKISILETTTFRNPESSIFSYLLENPAVQSHNTASENYEPLVTENYADVYYYDTLDFDDVRNSFPESGDSDLVFNFFSELKHGLRSNLYRSGNDPIRVSNQPGSSNHNYVKVSKPCCIDFLRKVFDSVNPPLQKQGKSPQKLQTDYSNFETVFFSPLHKNKRGDISKLHENPYSTNTKALRDKSNSFATHKSNLIPNNTESLLLPVTQNNMGISSVSEKQWPKAVDSINEQDGYSDGNRINGDGEKDAASLNFEHEILHLSTLIIIIPNIETNISHIFQDIYKQNNYNKNSSTKHERIRNILENYQFSDDSIDQNKFLSVIFRHILPPRFHHLIINHIILIGESSTNIEQFKSNVELNRHNATFFKQLKFFEDVEEPIILIMDPHEIEDVSFSGQEHNLLNSKRSVSQNNVFPKQNTSNLNLSSKYKENSNGSSQDFLQKALNGKVLKSKPKGEVYSNHGKISRMLSSLLNLKIKKYDINNSDEQPFYNSTDRNYFSIFNNILKATNGSLLVILSQNKTSLNDEINKNVSHRFRRSSSTLKIPIEMTGKGNSKKVILRVHFHDANGKYSPLKNINRDLQSMHSHIKPNEDFKKTKSINLPVRVERSHRQTKPTAYIRRQRKILPSNYNDMENRSNFNQRSRESGKRDLMSTSDIKFGNILFEDEEILVTELPEEFATSDINNPATLQRFRSIFQDNNDFVSEVFIVNEEGCNIFKMINNNFVEEKCNLDQVQYPSKNLNASMNSQTNQIEVNEPEESLIEASLNIKNVLSNKQTDNHSTNDKYIGTEKEIRTSSTKRKKYFTTPSEMFSINSGNQYFGPMVPDVLPEMDFKPIKNTSNKFRQVLDTKNHKTASSSVVNYIMEPETYLKTIKDNPRENELNHIEYEPENIDEMFPSLQIDEIKVFTPSPVDKKNKHVSSQKNSKPRRNEYNYMIYDQENIEEMLPSMQIDEINIFTPSPVVKENKLVISQNNSEPNVDHFNQLERPELQIQAEFSQHKNDLSKLVQAIANHHKESMNDNKLVNDLATSSNVISTMGNVINAYHENLPESSTLSVLESSIVSNQTSNSVITEQNVKIQSFLPDEETNIELNFQNDSLNHEDLYELLNSHIKENSMDISSNVDGIKYDTEKEINIEFLLNGKDEIEAVKTFSETKDSTRIDDDSSGFHDDKKMSNDEMKVLERNMLPEKNELHDIQIEENKNIQTMNAGDKEIVDSPASINTNTRTKVDTHIRDKLNKTVKLNINNEGKNEVDGFFNFDVVNKTILGDLLARQNKSDTVKNYTNNISLTFLGEGVYNLGVVNFDYHPFSRNESNIPVSNALKDDKNDNIRLSRELAESEENDEIRDLNQLTITKEKKDLQNILPVLLNTPDMIRTNSLNMENENTTNLILNFLISKLRDLGQDENHSKFKHEQRKKMKLADNISKGQAIKYSSQASLGNNLEILLLNYDNTDKASTTIKPMTEMSISTEEKLLGTSQPMKDHQINLVRDVNKKSKLNSTNKSNVQLPQKVNDMNTTLFSDSDGFNTSVGISETLDIINTTMNPELNGEDIMEMPNNGSTYNSYSMNGTMDSGMYNYDTVNETFNTGPLNPDTINSTLDAGTYSHSTDAPISNGMMSHNTMNSTVISVRKEHMILEKQSNLPDSHNITTSMINHKTNPRTLNKSLTQNQKLNQISHTNKPINLDVKHIPLVNERQTSTLEEELFSKDKTNVIVKISINNNNEAEKTDNENPAEIYKEILFINGNASSSEEFQVKPKTSFRNSFKNNNLRKTNIVNFLKKEKMDSDESQTSSYSTIKGDLKSPFTTTGNPITAQTENPTVLDPSIFKATLIKTERQIKPKAIISNPKPLINSKVITKFQTPERDENKNTDFNLFAKNSNFNGKKKRMKYNREFVTSVPKKKLIPHIQYPILLPLETTSHNTVAKQKHDSDWVWVKPNEKAESKSLFPNEDFLSRDDTLNIELNSLVTELNHFVDNSEPLQFSGSEQYSTSSEPGIPGHIYGRAEVEPRAKTRVKSEWRW